LEIKFLSALSNICLESIEMVLGEEDKNDQKGFQRGKFVIN